MNKDHSFFNERRSLFISGIALIVIAVVFLLVMFIKRQTYLRNEIKERVAVVKAGPEVRVVTAKRSPGERSVTLVGEARPYAEVTLYAKVSGYLKEIRVDKGDRVDAGQILAVIESPELDRQYDAALFDAKNKLVYAEREKILGDKGYISKQEAEDSGTAAKVAEANAESLRMQKDYEILRAPFSATVTARFADPGALVQSAVNAQTTALPVLNLSRTDKLRIYIYLDQRDAVFVHVGDRAEISDAARSDVRLYAPVARISGQLDARTRTLLTELDLENRNGRILAGSFVQVSLTLKTTPAVEIPAAALLMKAEKAFVAVVTPGNKVEFRPVTIVDSDAKTARFSSGLDEGERVVLNPGWGISDGQQVQPVAAPAQ